MGEAEITPLAAAAARARIEIPPEDASAVTLFLSLATQWREGFGGPVGLDYTAIRPTAEMLGIAVDPALFMDLRVMEGEALKVWAGQRKKL